MEKELFYGGEILTFDDSHPEAVLVEGGKITNIGSKSDLIKKFNEYEKVKQTNLNGMTLCPSFIDFHSYIYFLGLTLEQVHLDSCHSFKDITDTIQEFITDRTIDGKTWVMGYYYDEMILEEKQHPTKELLDSVCLYNPCMIIHKTWHKCVCNSIALKFLKITKDTEDPKDGYIGRNSENDKTPNGFLENRAFYIARKMVPLPTIDAVTRTMIKAQDYYLSNGVTHCQEGFCSIELWKILNILDNKNQLKIDIYAYIDITKYRDFVVNYIKEEKDKPKRLHMAGYAIVLDGSLQKNDNTTQKPNSFISDEELEKYINQADEDGIEIQAHCSSSSAVDQFIRVMDKVYSNKEKKPKRPIMVNAHFIDEKQFAKMKELNIVVSFFISQLYHEGDKHLENTEEEKAKTVFPLGSALKSGVSFNVHQNSPPVQQNMLEAIWCSCNRVTKGGHFLGEKEAISPKEALKAVTLYPAFGYSIDSYTGSIEVGKQANFVILDRNILTIPKKEIKNVRVIKTIKEGKVLYNDKNTANTSVCCNLI